MRRLALLLLAVLPLIAACAQQMADQPKKDPLEAEGDGTSARVPVAGTVPIDADLSPTPEDIPFPVTMALLERGHQRFDIFCSPCHGRTAEGNGLVVQRGFPAPPNFHTAALRQAPDRHFFDVITNGYGAMYSYAARVPPADRWAIVAYVRALQLSQWATVPTLPADLQARLAEAVP